MKLACMAWTISIRALRVEHDRYKFTWVLHNRQERLSRGSRCEHFMKGFEADGGDQDRSLQSKLSLPISRPAGHAMLKAFPGEAKWKELRRAATRFFSYAAAGSPAHTCVVRSCVLPIRRMWAKSSSVATRIARLRGPIVHVLAIGRTTT